MNRMETKQLSDNELIAEFMGIDWENATFQWRPGASRNMTIEDLDNYRTNWSWLMPVVAKITPIAKGMSQQAWFDVKYHLIDADIKVVYDHVVRFIKWYSNQPQKAS